MSTARRIISEIIKQKMFRVSHPDPDKPHVFVWSENAEDQLQALLGEVHGRLQALEGLDEFMTKLANGADSIVSSDKCTPLEMAEAKAQDRMIVRADGLGFVIRL